MEPVTMTQHEAYDTWTEADLIELYEERAAIREHDGGMVREVAEKAAYWDWRCIVGRHRVVPDAIQARVKRFKEGATSGPN